MTQEENLNGLPREKLTEVLESFRDPEVFNALMSILVMRQLH